MAKLNLGEIKQAAQMSSPNKLGGLSVGHATKEKIPSEDVSVFYGEGSVGKTSLCTFYPNVVFLKTENGLDKLAEYKDNNLPNCASVGGEYLQDRDGSGWPSIVSFTDSLLNDEHDYKTLVVDTLDGVEIACRHYTAQKAFGGETVAFENYGKGWVTLLNDYWGPWIRKVRKLAEEKMIKVILLAHDMQETMNNVGGDNYKYKRPNMNNKVWDYTKGMVDHVGFIEIDVTVKDKKAKGYGNRLMRLANSPYCYCKNRAGIQDLIELGSESPEKAYQVVSSAFKKGN